MIKRPLSYTMRIYHRYLGFFLSGIMAVYAMSGIVLIFRNTDAFKNKQTLTQHVGNHLSAEQLAAKLKLRKLQFDKVTLDFSYFKGGFYNHNTGEVRYTETKYPLFLEKLTQLHKANTDSPLFFLNIFFGLSLFFFVVSSFWMFLPKTEAFKKGMYFAMAGTVLTLLMLLF